MYVDYLPVVKRKDERKKVIREAAEAVLMLAGIIVFMAILLVFAVAFQ